MRYPPWRRWVMMSWAMTRPDWTVPFDDHLTARLARCTLCGASPLVWVWAREVHGLAISIGQCRGCRKQDPEHQQVDALLRQRYNPARWGIHSGV